MRYFIEFSYNGKAYHGWQKQPNAMSVQEDLEQALSTMLRATIEVVGAGRTDAGVHAKQMYAHFDVENILPVDFVRRLNSFLGSEIAIHRLQLVHDDAHARFDATARTYEYWIVQHKDVFLKEFSHCVLQPLDVEAMNTAAALMFDYNDFQCFSKSNTDVKTYLCKLMHAQFTMRDDRIVFTITADRFLRNMVRAVVGTLLEIGLGKQPIDHIKKVIESKSRTKAGVSVPGHALYLTEVKYPYIK